MRHRPAGSQRRRIKVIDVHAHCVIPVGEIVKSTPLAKEGSGGGNLGPDRLTIMDQQGVDVQALSIKGYWWYAADRALATRIVHAQNEGLATWVSAHADRFVGLASVALQHRDLAAEQLHDAVTRLGMRGASIGGHVNGEDLSLPKYDPFWAKAAELGALVFMHPGGATNIVKEGALGGRGDLGNIIGNPLETVRGCHTQGRTVDEARRRIREALGLFVGDARKAAIVADVKLPTVATKAIRAYAALRKKADEEDRRASRAARRAVRVLRTGKLKMSARDTARLLGLSHQRVHQLTHEGVSREELEGR